MLRDLDHATDAIDTKIIVWCVLMMLVQLQKPAPALVPDLVPFRQEATDTQVNLNRSSDRSKPGLFRTHPSPSTTLGAIATSGIRQRRGDHKEDRC